MECLVKLSFLSLRARGQGCAACAPGWNSWCPEALGTSRNQAWLIAGAHPPSRTGPARSSTFPIPLDEPWRRLKGGVSLQCCVRPSGDVLQGFPSHTFLVQSCFWGKLWENLSGSSHRWYQTPSIRGCLVKKCKAGRAGIPWASFPS